MTDSTLGDARDRIDSIDRQLVELLAARMASVREIAAAKEKASHAPLRDLDREREVFEAWARDAEERGLSSYYIGRVLREVLNYSRRIQEGLLDRRQDEVAEPAIKVGYQGVPGAFSHLALQKLFHFRANGEAVEPVGFRSFGAATDALEAGEIRYALLPIENTIAGSLNEVYQLLATRSISIVDEEIWPVEHCLVALPEATIESIRVIRSHPVALQQCQRFLSGMPGAMAESTFDTAASAESVAAEGRCDVAAICSEEIARTLGLQVLRRGIADVEANFTRFVLLATRAETVDLRMPAKTSLIFTVNHRQGALAECLQIFAREGINLTKLESRHQPETPWEYLFYLDLEANPEDPRVREALQEVRGHTGHFKVLGTYPRRWIDDESRVRGGVRERRVEATESRVPEPASAAPIEPRPTRAPRERSIVTIGRVEVGGDTFVVMSGPCAVEGRGQIMDAAALVESCGIRVFRGGAFKPRSSPYSFQGLGFPGLELLNDAAKAYELSTVTEVLRSEDVDRIAESADALQVGTRNMQNFELLKKLGTIAKPVVLKRGMSATIEELLSAAEYIMSGGNQRVILCERGIRTFEKATRATLDLSAVPVLKERTALPVIVDPSHAAGRRELVIPLALAAAAVGADGLLVESHPIPNEALCDKEQALTPDDLRELMRRLEPIVRAQGRTL
ncbi:MAG: 3-deoxy-7-phosphoheptulonate synthase [Planctomycetes bacterium]|nr:3-deoxy-7-phosphoheptulonate synthase [Planctomycetota bacterium]